MPKLWSQTIEAHRREVRDAILDATAALVAEQGLLGVTMSRVAELAGIGRATLYKYFAGVDEVLQAWHERRVTAHLARLTEIAERDGSPLQRLAAVLEEFALIQVERAGHSGHGGGGGLAAALHHQEVLAPAERRLRALVAGLIVQAAEAGEVRRDAPAEQLAGWCLHALGAAGGSSSKAAARRLAAITLDGLRPAG